MTDIDLTVPEFMRRTADERPPRRAFSEEIAARRRARAVARECNRLLDKDCKRKARARRRRRDQANKREEPWAT